MNLEPSSEFSGQEAAGVVVLDDRALERLRELDPDGGHGVLRRVLTAFETSLAQKLAQLAAMRAGGDTAALTAVAHTLKSSSASVGALALAATCAEVEGRLRSAPAGPALVCGAELEALTAKGQAALDAVRALLRS